MSRAIIIILVSMLPISMALAERDPMQPPMALTDTVERDAPGWVLNSVLFSDERNVAVINQRPVRVGEIIHGARVLEIYPDRVRLSRADKTFLIKLQSLSVKQPVRGQ